MVTQPNYNKKSLKRKYQLAFFKKAENKKSFIGLCGPTPKGYLTQIKAAGFAKIILMDRDSANLNQNMQVFRDFNKKGNVTVQCGDINAMLNQNAFYDLDYCRAITHLLPSTLDKIVKIKEFCLTIAIRPKSEESTIDYIKQYTKRTFLYRVYREGGTPMMICYFPMIKK